MAEPKSKSKQFPETNWNLVRQATGGGTTTRRSALEKLCQLYWPPIYAFIRSKGNPPHDAEDLTQGFFAEFLRREDLEKTDSSKGLLRTYLLASVKNYLAGEHRKATRQKRGGGSAVISFDSDEAEAYWATIECSDNLTPDKIFVRQWVRTLLENVLQKIESIYTSENKAALFIALKPNIVPGAEKTKQAMVAKDLGLSNGAVRTAAFRLRERYAKILKEEVTETMSPGEDADREIKELMAVFA